MSISAESHLNATGSYMLGVGADFFSVVVTQPIDTAMTHVMNRTPMPAPGPWLWRGCKINCYGALIHGGVPFLINGVFTDHFLHGEELSHGQLIANGIFTGMIGAGVIAPFERMAKLHQLHGGSLHSVCQRSMGENGGRSFYKAIAPIALRDSIVFGTFFGARHVVESILEPYVSHDGLRKGGASICTGMIAGLISTPLQRVNVLMQADTAGEYPTLAKTVVKVVQQEGMKSLFRGGITRCGFMSGYYLTLALGEKMLKGPLQCYFSSKTRSSETGV